MGYQVGDIFHIIHIAENWSTLDRWYDKVFHPVTFGQEQTDVFPYSASIARDASMLAIADTVVEATAPAMRAEGWQNYPIGRFYRRFGQHWHSLAWDCDDLGNLWERLTARGLTIFSFDGTVLREFNNEPAILTHPRETFCQLQFATAGSVPGDPRKGALWPERWATQSELSGILGLSHATVTTTNCEEASELFCEAFGAKLLGTEESGLLATRSIFVELGSTVLECAESTSERGLASEDLANNGPTLHALNWRVRDLEETVRYLDGVGVRVLARDEMTMLADPLTTFGGVMRFTTSQIPGA